MSITSELEKLLNEFIDKPTHINDKYVLNLPRFIVKVNVAKRNDDILYTLIPSKTMASTKEAIDMLMKRVTYIVSLHEDAEFELHIFDKDVIKKLGGDTFLSSHVIKINKQQEEN